MKKKKKKKKNSLCCLTTPGCSVLLSEGTFGVTILVERKKRCLSKNIQTQR